MCYLRYFLSKLEVFVIETAGSECSLEQSDVYLIALLLALPHYINLPDVTQVRGGNSSPAKQQ